MKNKLFKILTASILLILILVLIYFKWMSPTKIATLNFPDFTVEKMIRSNSNAWVKIKTVDLDKIDKLSKYDIVLVRIHGSSLNQTHLDAIKSAIDKGVPVLATESDNAEINSFAGTELAYLSTLLNNESVKNYSSLFNYFRKNVDRKKCFNQAYFEPLIVPSDYYFHLGEDEFFSDYASYQAFYEQSGRYKEGAPRIVLLSGNINMQNSNSEHFDALVSGLESRGLNVYPIHSMGMKKLSLIRSVSPDLIINRPHGRLLMGQGEKGVELLKTLNVPILAPITVSELYGKWINDKQGLSSGGMTSMSVVMPELDGAIVPFAIAAQFDKNGMKIFDAIPNHTDKFCSMVEKFVSLRKKENKDKKVAIYYYKGLGKGTLSAADIEGVQSLYNTLRNLKNNGYNLNGLPDNVKAFEALIQKEGAVLGPYALGAFDDYLKNGNPASVDEASFIEWAKKSLPEELISDITNQYGAFPGDYLAFEKNNEKYVGVSRITFGNVTILPQPLPSVGDDTQKIIHGVKGAPAYPYVASYLWTRHAFKTDALIHFGTHGSLEFIPGKQLALSDYDWTDALVGDLPHFYIYTINNIGEGIIAKRRSYATLISHLTAPFMQSELYDDLRTLKSRISSFENLEEGPVKANHRATITRLAKEQNLLSALNLDTTRVLNDDEIEKVHICLEEIDGSKVNDGLYTLGIPYSPENVANTVRLMAIDPIRYALAQIDFTQGKIKEKDLSNLLFVSNRYNSTTERLIKRAITGSNADELLKSVLSSSNYQILQTALVNEKIEAEKRTQMMMAMMQAATDAPEKTIVYLDENGDLIKDSLAAEPAKKRGGHPAGIPKIGRRPDRPSTADTSEQKTKSAMSRMAEAEPLSVSDQTSDEEQKAKDLITALKDLKFAIDNIFNWKHNLEGSTANEQKALLNALNGGFVAPSSGGDPIINPQAVPTGRNFYSINPETVPSDEAWQVGKRLAEDLLANEMTQNGAYPQKISFTLWSTDFISTEGATIAQILYLLGVEPLRDGFGYIRSLRLIPVEVLGRPRVDVVIQTSGQLRDIAASRLDLINRAITMAAEADDKDIANYVKKGFNDAERLLLDKGYSPVDARTYAKERIFGGVNGNYGSGITGLVEKGDAWEEREQIASQYINNMGALYSANGSEAWGEFKEGVFEAALLNTSVVVQPRSSNTWGPLSLDHVYEFMGGLSAAVEHVTGNDPTAYFNDFRNSSRPKVQGLKESISVETNSTIFNPKYIKEMLKGEASSLEYFAETMRNTFGWNSMKPSAIDQHIWNKYYDIYVEDEYKLNLQTTFNDKNPYAMQEMTAVMLESARKGMWQATDEQIKNLSDLHVQFVTEKGAGCSGFVCDNAKLKEFISKQVDQNSAKNYNENINKVRQIQVESEQAENSMVLKKESDNSRRASEKESSQDSLSFLYVVIAVVVILLLLLLRRRFFKK